MNVHGCLATYGSLPTGLTVNFCKTLTAVAHFVFRVRSFLYSIDSPRLS